MGCDYYANEKGEFKIKFRKWLNGELIGIVELKNLKPKEQINTDLIKGKER